MIKIHKLIGDLQSNLERCQANLSEIKNILIPFARKPLFERKDGRKDTFLSIDDRKDLLMKRHAGIKEATDRIKHLLEENQEIFDMTHKQDSVEWTNYIDYIDNVVTSYLYQSVGCR